MSRFQFVEGRGLFCAEVNHFISEFDLEVRRIFVRKKISLDGNLLAQKLIYEIGAQLMDGSYLPSRTVKRLSTQDLFSLWHEIADAGLSTRVRSLLLERLQQSAACAEREIMYEVETPGLYLIDGKNPVYAVGNQILFPKSQAIPNLELNDEMKGHAWNLSEDILVRTDLLKNYVELAPGVSVILLYAILLAAIKPLLVSMGYIPSTNLIIYGESGTGKTLLARTMCILTKDMESFTWASVLNDKKNETLHRLKKAFGFVFVLDDFHPVAAGYNQKRQLELMNATLRFVESNAESPVLVVTAEYLDGSYSMQDRLLQVRLSEINVEVLKKIQNNLDLLPSIARNFVQTLLDNYTGITEMIKEFYEKSVISPKLISREDRQSAELLMVADLYEKYMGESHREELREALEMQIQIQKKHMRLVKSKNSTDYIALLYKLIQEDKVYKICSDMIDEYKLLPTQIFLKDGNAIYMTKVALKYGLGKYYDEKTAAGLVKKVIADLKENDLLLQDRDTTCKKFLGVRHLCISLYALKGYMSVRSYGKKEE